NKGKLINNGQVIISGAWINTGDYDPGTGQVNFDSDLDQVINHNAQSIEKLVISGGGQKEFLADIFVKSQLVLTDGILVSKNGARIVMDNDVAIVGGSDAAHINGPVEIKGSGDWLFPIGNGSTYLPVLIFGASGANPFGIVTLHELANGETLSGELELEKLSTKRYWELASGGNLEGATISLPTPADERSIGPELVVAASNTPLTGYQNLGVSDGITTYVRSEKAPTFKYYAAAKLLIDRAIDVYNAISPGNDGKNDFMTIQNIEFYPDNKVVIHNRWGDRVYEVTGYDNNQNAFTGHSSNGNRLPAGTYFYTIDLGNGSEKVTGYVVIK
ncbi:MAG TPA: gliding motility-associated C-terminal domain-containing protein, partial [Cyclobacteriaceae bacterium]|nr:gliding motility-associated C-terminal domain-containing protein [Cyclobacteriaceae bacterium]